MKNIIIIITALSAFTACETQAHKEAFETLSPALNECLEADADLLRLNGLPTNSYKALYLECRKREAEGGLPLMTLEQALRD